MKEQINDSMVLWEKKDVVSQSRHCVLKEGQKRKSKSPSHYARQTYYELIVVRQIEGEQREERTGHSPVGLLAGWYGTGKWGRGTRTKGFADSQEAKRDRTRECTQTPAGCNKRAL